MLDGLRALACAFVVFGHFSPQDGTYRPRASQISDYFGFPNYGVILFFCISAFLLSYLYVREYDRTGGNNVRYFFVRRTLRIWPLYISFLIAINAMTAWGFFHGTASAEYIHKYNALLFTYLPNWIYATNISTNHIPVGDTSYLNVLWSLGVEEQIYVLFPFVSTWLLNRKSGMNFALGIVALSVVSRLGYTLFCTTKLNGGMYYSTLSYFDVYLIAALFGAMQARKRFGALMTSIGNPYIFWASIAVLFCLMHIFAENALAPYPWINLVSYPALSALTSFCIIWLLNSDENAFVRLLASTPVRAYGVLSYSLYVWHMTVLYFVNQYCAEHGLMTAADLKGRPAVVLLFFLFYLSITLAAACLSHGVIERPFLAIKERYSETGSVNFFSWKKYFGTAAASGAVCLLLLFAIYQRPQRDREQCRNLPAGRATG